MLNETLSLDAMARRDRATAAALHARDAGFGRPVEWSRQTRGLRMTIALTAILHRAPRGAPLFAYKVTTQEVTALASELRSACVAAQRFDAPRCMSLCFFLAERLCQTYTSGAWKWEDVLREIEWSRSTQSLHQTIERGLIALERPLRRMQGGHRAFLGTLVCEGGIPRQILLDADNRLTHFLRELIRMRETYGHSVDQIAARLARDLSLPERYRDDTTFQALASALVESVCRLRERIPLGASNPFEHLTPGWERDVPLRVEEDAARKLLNGLLRAPRDSAAERSQLPAFVETVLTVTDVISLFRRVDSRRVTSEAQLRRLLSLEASQDLPGRGYLQLLTGEGQPRELGLVERRTRDHHTEYLIRARPDRVFRDPSTLHGRVLIALASGGRQLACAELPGGSSLPRDAPWVFEGRAGNEEHRLVAVGSVARAVSSLVVVAPKGSEVDASDPLEELGTAPDGRRVLRLTGAAVLRSGQDQWAIKASEAAQSADTRYAVRGNLHRLGFFGSEVYKGPVHIFRICDGVDGPVAGSDIDWRPAGAMVGWRPYRDTCYGDGTLRARDPKGGGSFRARVAILPSDFTIDTRVDRQELSISSSRLTGLAFLTPKGAVQIRRSGSQYTLSAAALPPELHDAQEIELRALFDSCEASLRVPVPRRTLAFIGREGKELRKTHNVPQVPLDRLASVRARVMTSDRRGILVLQATPLRPTQPGGTPEAIRDESGGSRTIRSFVITARVTEIVLDTLKSQLRAMLAATDSLDGVVDLRLSVAGSIRGDDPVVRVTRYEGALKPSFDGLVRLETDEFATIDPQLRAAACVQARPILEPSREPMLLPRSAETTWSTSPLEPGFWMLQALIGGVPRARPLIVEAPGELPEIQPGLTTAVLVRDRAARREAIDAALSLAAADWEHADIPLIASYFGTLGTVPAVTFDTVARLRLAPDLLAMVMLKTSSEQMSLAWEAMQELPFLWPAMPLRSWIRAAQRLDSWLERMISAGSLSRPDKAQWLQSTLGRLIRETQSVAPFLSIVGRLWTSVLANCRIDGLHDSVSQARTEQGRRSLRQYRATQLASTRTRFPDGAPMIALETLANHCLSGTESRADLWGNDHDIPPELDCVARVPGIVAAAALHGHSIPDRLLLEVRTVRAFDREWFDFAHSAALTLLVGARLEKDRHFPENLA